MAKTVKERKFECEERDANGLVYRRILLPKVLDDILIQISTDLEIDKLNVRGFKIDKGDKTKAMALMLGSTISNHFGDLIDWVDRGKRGLCGISLYQGRLSVVRYSDDWSQQRLQMQIDLEKLERELKHAAITAN